MRKKSATNICQKDRNLWQALCFNCQVQPQQLISDSPVSHPNTRTSHNHTLRVLAIITRAYTQDSVRICWVPVYLGLPLAQPSILQPKLPCMAKRHWCYQRLKFCCTWLPQIEKIDTKCQKTLQKHVDAPQDAIEIENNRVGQNVPVKHPAHVSVKWQFAVNDRIPITAQQLDTERHSGRAPKTSSQ